MSTTQTALRHCFTRLRVAIRLYEVVTPQRKRRRTTAIVTVNVIGIVIGIALNGYHLIVQSCIGYLQVARYKNGSWFFLYNSCYGLDFGRNIQIICFTPPQLMGVKTFVGR